MITESIFLMVTFATQTVHEDAFRIKVDSSGTGHPDPIHPAVQVGLEYIGELLNHVAGP